MESLLAKNLCGDESRRGIATQAAAGTKFPAQYDITPCARRAAAIASRL
jgi:hypothetical protein